MSIELKGWVELVKKPITIGDGSRGFIIDKDKLRLKHGETYIIRIIPERCFNETNDI